MGRDPERVEQNLVETTKYRMEQSEQQYLKFLSDMLFNNLIN